ncbi:MAG: hypothetical protein FWF46_02240 [Oscillospiraceae bacterium]|nr:hypothetical protein [Oscillospiraceae bacterium]
MANKKFGTLVTETCGGYTWNENSRLNRLTAWNNNQVTDVPSEIIYLKNKETGNTWTLGLSVIPVNTDYYITYGFGYAKFKQQNDGILQENEIFVGKEEAVKINKITLKNMQNVDKKLKLIYYIKPVLGEDEIKTCNYIETEHVKEYNIVSFKNLSNNNKIAYISSSENITSYTGNKASFMGNGSISNPLALKKISLNNKNGIFEESIIAVQLEIEVPAQETKELVIILGEEDDYLKMLENKEKFTSLENVKTELELVKKYWQETLSSIQVQTPMESINIMLNGWIMYQTLVSRMWGRTGYYQSGGAFGFRDQLQDTLGAKYIDKNIMREQILKAASHQFIEGDVEHWWHEENNSGVRTRFGDDLLWLPYVVSEYLKFTGDYKILLEEVPFVQGEPLKEGQDEDYNVHLPTEEKASILEHCLLAINKGVNIGQNGLIKIGCGDWNDGFSTVGNKGIGESVWLSFFVYDVLGKMIEILEDPAHSKVFGEFSFKFLEIDNFDNLISQYRQIQFDLKKNINQNGWDGRWFRRAYMDNGKILGTISNEECKIDSIAQSWAIISNAADNDKKYIAFESLEKYLIDRENAILKLLTPAFEKSDLEPGYIKAYPPGVRENGGQYTHGCCGYDSNT